MLLPASVADNVVACHSAEHPCGASALRGARENPIRFLYVSGSYFVPMVEKIRCFLIAGLKMETIMLFYLLLIGLTLVALTLRVERSGT